ncbi:MAG TPA: response regulator [Nitrospirae bacterium]|nr:response regulator rcp1 [bacterium BMS3Abin10]GBE38744.1 response regulator rcp1 [bacterium BMS3Bbin08]HDO26009.1 response regulator [Nitrospirota bacterium]
MRYEKPIDILLVEDNPTDVEIIKEAFSVGKVKNNLYCVRDGQEALDFMYHENEFSDASKAPRPDLILLDLNMPRVNGTEVLEKIKKDKELLKIPIIILTSSDRDRDVCESYNLGANSFITKPVGFPRFIEVVTSIQDYWLVITKIPRK